MNSNQENQKPLAPDTQLQYFKILKYLARGGFGITYIALDTKRNRPVVIKEYFPSMSAFRNGQDSTVSLLSTSHSDDYQEGLRRFQREAVTLSDFKHPNIVEVIAFFESNNTAYFVMEFIEGESLQDKLNAKNGKPFTEAEIQQDFLPILKGLKQIHSMDLLHLDIKPENILQTKYGEPLLIDFGGARFATGQASQDHSSMVATTGYAPPEQYSLSQEQTPASDIYAFGMTLYTLMAPKEELPDSKDRQNALLEDMPDPLKPIREVAKGYSEKLYELVEKCTQIKKSSRPQSIEAIDGLMQSDNAKKQSSKNESKLNVQACSRIKLGPRKFDELRSLAENGDAEAQFYLGDMYAFGDGVNQDPVKAKEWFTKSAEQGDSDAQYNLGLMYLNGTGVNQDHVKAKEWLTKSAEQGDSGAQASLLDIERLKKNSVRYESYVKEQKAKLQKIKTVQERSVLPNIKTQSDKIITDWKYKKPLTENKKMSFEPLVHAIFNVIYNVLDGVAMIAVALLLILLAVHFLESM